MFSFPFKQIFITPEGRLFVRYRNSRVHFMARVIRTDTTSSMSGIIERYNQYTAQTNMPPASFSFPFTGFLYIVVLSEIFDDNKPEATAREAYYNHTLKRIADWLKFTYLLPQEREMPHKQVGCH